MPRPDPDPNDASHTIGSALRELTAHLTRAGIEDAGGDVRRLVGAVLDLSGAAVLSKPERPLTGEQFETLRRYVGRREKREPVARILGERDFYGRAFAISPATLDPRPDSETLVVTALDIARDEGWLARPLRILDVGTGSGCLLLTLLCELPNARGTGTDISEAALAIARENAHRLDVASRAVWVAADALEGVDGPFDIMVCNPPYIRSSDIALLDADVRDFDPPLALDGGADGLAVYRRLMVRIPIVIPDGWVVFEVGHDQADAVAALLASEVRGIDAAEILFNRDVAGKRRCVAARTRD